MKKFAILCGMALGLGLVACDDMLPNPPAQSNPDINQVFTDADLEVSQAGYGVTDPIVLADFVNEGQQVPVLDVTKLDNFPAGYTLSMPMEVGDNADFSHFVTVATETKDNVIYVSGEQLNSAIRSMISKSPEVQTVNIRFRAYAVNPSNAGDATMVLGGEDYFYATLEYKIKPLQTYVIEEAYYLVGNFCDWEVARGIKLERTEPSKNLYDAPIFAAVVDVTPEMAALPFEWKVVPASSFEANSWEGAYGAQPAMIEQETEEGEEPAEPQPDPTKGTLVESPEAETQAGVISEAGPFLITINAEELTYTVSYAFDNLWVAGPGSSTSAFTKMQKLYTDNHSTFFGAAKVNRRFYLTAQESNTGNVLMLKNGTTPVTEGYVTNGEMQMFGSSNDGARLEVGAHAMYWIDANLGAMTYTATQIATLSLVGEFNGWHENPDAEGVTEEQKPVQLKRGSDYLTWTGTATLGGLFKINANNAWTIDFGGTAKDITVADGTPVDIKCKGENLSVAQGTYDVTVSFAKYPYTIKLVKK